MFRGQYCCAEATHPLARLLSKSFDRYFHRIHRLSSLISNFPRSSVRAPHSAQRTFLDAIVDIIHDKLGVLIVSAYKRAIGADRDSPCNDWSYDDWLRIRPIRR